MNNLIINDLVKQNPWWVDPQAKAIDPAKIHRDIFETLKERILHRELITSLVGLRRVGKSTLIPQIIDHLLQAGQSPTTILYFSFEELPEKDAGASLRAIIEYQLKKCPKEKSYLFFDEIQYVDRWNSVLKHYVDHYAQLKFTISGSASLSPFAKYLGRKPVDESEEFFASEGFRSRRSVGRRYPDRKVEGASFIASTAHESLAGRIQELVLRPMGYGNDITNLLDVLIDHSGQMVEIQNLAHDLHLAQNTVREYLRLLEKTYLVSQNFNLGIGFRTRSVRQRKIYATSVNALVLKTVRGLNSDLWQHNVGSIIETFVYNYLLRKNEGEINFWRQRQIKEVDFVYSTPETKLPIEVKYQNHIRPGDLENMLYYCGKEHLKKAMVVTKNEQDTKHINGVKISFTPALALL